jgi:pantetheine-phosphate adenylyltransferase
MTIAVYAGSFDPFTHGHESIVRGAFAAFDEVIVAIGVNSKKAPLFSTEERTQFVKSYFKPRTIRVVSFEGLLVKYCESLGEGVVIVRGLRAVSDFEIEMAIADANKRLDPTIQTVFIPSPAVHAFVSSSVVRELALVGASELDLSQNYVTPEVARALRERLCPPASK